MASNNFYDWWVFVPGANWKKPYGPAAVVAQAVVHRACADMQACAAGQGGKVERQFSASAGGGKSVDQPGAELANSWQGVFPVVNEMSDGFKGVAPVGCFRSNAFGLYDMVGNVWEVTADLYRPGHDLAERDNPRGPNENAANDPHNPGLRSRVMEGASDQCAPNYCQRYRPESRQGRDPGLGASNVGFRLVYDKPPSS